MGYGNRSNTAVPCIAVGRVGALCGNVHLVDPPAWVTDNALLLSDLQGFRPAIPCAATRGLGSESVGEPERTATDHRRVRKGAASVSSILCGNSSTSWSAFERRTTA